MGQCIHALSHIHLTGMQYQVEGGSRLWNDKRVFLKALKNDGDL